MPAPPGGRAVEVLAVWWSAVVVDPSCDREWPRVRAEAASVTRTGVVRYMSAMDPREKPVPAMWRAEIDQWTAAMRASGRSPNTIVTRADHLRRLARALDGDPWDVTLEQLLDWSGRQSWARETRRSVRASLLAFYRWGVLVGRLSASPAEALPRVEPGQAIARPAPEQVYRDALTRADERTRLILRLAAEVGLRRGEIARIHSRDLRPDLIGMSLVVHGKGGRTREVPLPEHVTLALQARGEGWAFPSPAGGHLTAQYVGKLATWLLPDDWTLHTLRHRFATRAYSAERDLLSVQTLLGHSSPTTTRRYVELPRDALRRAMEAAG